MSKNDQWGRYGKYATQPLLLTSVFAGPLTWRFALGGRQDGRSSLRLELVEAEPSDPEKERIRAVFVVTSAGDFERIS